MIAVKYGDAVCAPVYPAAKSPVPPLDLQDSGGVRALGVDKQLFAERKPVVAAGSGQKCPPRTGGSHPALGFPVQLRQSLVADRHWLHLPSILSF